MNAIVRNYKNQDKEALLQLLRLNTPKYFSPEEEKDFLHYLDNEIEFYFVLEIDNIVIGGGGFNFSEDFSIGIISWDILHPDFQGQSFGSLLLNYRIEKLKEFKNLQTITVRTSQMAYRFYEKLGFKIIKTAKDYWAKGFDLYQMEYVDL